MNSSPTAPREPVQAKPAPRPLRSATARRTLAAGTALPFLMTLVAAFLPVGPAYVVLATTAFPLIVIAIFALRAATQWKPSRLRIPDERERGELRTVLGIAYAFTFLMFMFMNVAASLRTFDEALTLDARDWTLLVGIAGFTHLVLPYAVLAWRMVDGPSDAS